MSTEPSPEVPLLEVLLKHSKDGRYCITRHLQTSAMGLNELKNFLQSAECRAELVGSNWEILAFDIPTLWFLCTLGPFGNIKALQLKIDCTDLHCGFSLSHEDLVKISECMPQLEVLRLGSPCASGGSETEIRHETFRMLTENCQNLSELVMHFNVEMFGYEKWEVDENSQVNNSRPSRHSLTWNVGKTDVRKLTEDDITFIALGLCKLPRKITLEFKGDPYEGEEIARRFTSPTVRTPIFICHDLSRGYCRTHYSHQ